MSNATAPSLEHLTITGPQPAEILALVAAAIPLPKSSITALRLTCKATKLAVDQITTDLYLPLAAADVLRIEDNPLLSGLTSLGFNVPLTDRDSGNLTMRRAVQMAVNNCQSLEALDTYYLYFYNDNQNRTALMDMLGACEWPRLRKLCLHLTASFEKHINIENMPALTELRTQNHVEASEIAALCRSVRFTSNIEVLDLYHGVSGILSEEFCDNFTDLVQASPKLRRLELLHMIFPNLDFLDNAELPNLEVLNVRVQTAPGGISLSPLVCFRRPRLHTLSVQSSRRRSLDPRSTVRLKDPPGSLLPLGCGAAQPFPVVENLSLAGFDCSNFGIILRTGATGLKSLALTDSSSGSGVGAHTATVAGTLASLHELETLELNLHGSHSQRFDTARFLHILLSNAALPALRRLKAGSFWKNEDGALACLIEFSDKLHLLEEIVLPTGIISGDGIDALAAAGRAGHWPHLKVFDVYQTAPRRDDDSEDEGYVYVSQEKMEESYSQLLQEAWPDLELRLRY